MSKLSEAIWLTGVCALVPLILLSAILNCIVLLKISMYALFAFAAWLIVPCLIDVWKAAKKEIKQKRKERDESEAGK